MSFNHQDEARSERKAILGLRNHKNLTSVTNEKMRFARLVEILTKIGQPGLYVCPVAYLFL